MVDESLINGYKDKQNENEEVFGKEFKMGFRSWHPDWLQRFNTINWFTVALCFASLVQGIIVNGVTNVSLQTIEKEFGLSSKVTGLIVTGNDVSAILLVSVVSFFGAKGNKPKWMGIGSIITAFGVLLFAVPKLLIGKYQPSNYNQNQTMIFDVCTHQKSLSTVHGCGTDTSGRKIVYIIFFYAAQLIMGAGTTPLYSLGPAYVDENVSPRASPVYLGLWFACTMMGPGFGFIVGGIFLKTFTNINLPKGMEEMTAHDPRWIGAWWLGYVCFSVTFLLFGFFLILFPSKMIKTSLKRQKLIKDGHLPSSDDKIEYTLKGYFKQTLKMCTNKIFILIAMGAAIKTFYGAGLITFLAKILVVKFGVLPQSAGLYIGAMLLPSFAVGILAGSIILRRIEVKMAAKTAAKISVIVSAVTIASPFIFLIPGCMNTNLAGVKVPYYNTTSMNSLSSICNDKCMCSEKNYMPICGSDGRTYHSPCFAGCTNFNMGSNKLPTFSNCSCIPADSTQRVYRNNSMNKLKVLLHETTFGKCDRNCKNFFLFSVLAAITVIIAFFASIPQKMMILRCVPDNQRSFALGTQFLIVRTLSFLPAPILLGAIIDAGCITWGFKKCGEKKNCFDYDIDKLSISIVLVGLITSVLALICYVLAWWWYPVADEKTSINELLRKEDDIL